jgi:3-oxoacyl-[acyl-carrier-protein] synthase-1
MIVIADNIISPLGYSSEENYYNVKAGKSALKRYEGKWGMPQAFCGSLFSDEQWHEIPLEAEYTHWERLMIATIKGALLKTDFDVTSDRVIFIISTTKGNVELAADAQGFPKERIYSCVGAGKVAEYFGNVNMPVVVSNACISGLHAQIVAKRLIEAGAYDYAVVIGAEVQSEFIVSGFMSLKALSKNPCRPFDIERNGLNVGEGCGVIIFAADNKRPDGAYMKCISGAVCNDAYHISSPSPVGEGLELAIRNVIGDCKIENLAFVNAHGTSTLYNDEMEAVAINRAGISEVPVNSLKGYYGHTMGAAGVVETILSMRAIEENIILGTRGFNELGVSKIVNITSTHRHTEKKAFLKVMSGFGGCNAAMLYMKGDCE